MNIKYAAVAAVLVGSFAVAPAFAGVADPKGGFNTDNTDYSKQIHDKYDSRTEYVDGNTSSTTVHGSDYATGTLTVKNHLGKVIKTINISKASPASVRKQLRDLANGYFESGRSGSTKITSKNKTDSDGDLHKHVKYYKNGAKDKRSYWSYGGDYMGDVYYDESTSFVKRTSTTQVIDDSTSSYSYDEVGEPVYTNTTTDTTTTVREGTIIAGSGDSLGNAFAAQGGVDRQTDVTDHYDQTTTTVTVIAQNHVEVTTTHDLYKINATVVVSPIVLDLDGDGRIEASNGQYRPHEGFSDNAVMFDFYGNGFPVMTEWVGSNDGILVRPRADGYVDGTCLFGTGAGYDNGFDALAAYDTNNDGVVSGKELTGLYVWTDVNGNGHAEESELHSLDSLGITAFNVGHNDYAGTFVRNGKTYKMFDWWPNINECRKVSANQ